MPAWQEGRLCAFDCETTGTDPETARIVQAAVVFVGGGRDTEAWTLIVDPGVEIPAEATAVHGITTARAQAEGRPAREAIGAIWEELDRMEPGWPLVVFNARYDLTVLNREMGRHGMAPFDETTAWVVDPLVIDKHLDRFRRGSRKLDATCAHYRATLEDAHDASSDALAAARVAWAIGRRGEVVRRVRSAHDARELSELRAEWARVRDDLALLHAAQVGWAAEQARGLAEYFAAKGEPQHVAPEWPVLPLRVGASA